MIGWFKLSVLASALFVVGCGGGVKEEQTDIVVIAPADMIKSMVSGVANTGESMGSGEDSLREAIAELRKTDSAKADALDAEFAKLVKASDAGARKAAAKSLLSKL